MTTSEDNDSEDGDPAGSLRISRRSAMKAAASVGAISGGFAGVASAQGDCADVSGPCDDCTLLDCTAQSGSCTPCLGGGCEEIPDSRLEAGTDFGEDLQCVTLSDEEIPDDADLAVIKAANECHQCEVVDTSGQTFCIDSNHDISHIEFADCPDADVTVDCPNDQAVVEVDGTDSVYFEVDYVHCDEADFSGTLSGSGDVWTDTVPLANCEGTITVWLTSDKAFMLDSVHFDCETAQVAVDCPSSTATIFASDTDEVWYSIDYEHCDEPDVGRTGPLDLSGDTDSATVPVANCEGTITVTDDDMNVLATAEFDCETAFVAEVNCPEDFAVIHAEDTSTVNYEVDYTNCDEPDASGTLDFSDTDDLTIPLANYEGTITLTDDDGTVLDTQHFDCETAQVSVDCPSSTATIFASDTSTVWYSIDYEHCDEPDVDMEMVDLSGDTDTATVPVANCEGTISVYDDDGNLLASAEFDCETAFVAEVDCPNDVAVVHAEDTQTVNYTVDYEHCDVDQESGSLDFSTTDDLTIPLQDCEGTITLTDDDGFVLDTADFDCETAQVSVECPPGSDHPVATISAEDTSTVDFSVDYDSTACTDESGSIDLSGSTDTVELALQNCDGTITITDDDGVVLDSATFVSCCPPCPDELSVKFEEQEIHVGSTESQTIDGTTYTFEITEVTTNEEGEATGVCFISNVAFCELEVGIQAGGGPEEDKVVIVEPNADGEYCFDTDELDRAISHFTIRCP